MSFADRLKEARRSCGLSQEELAEQLDVSRQALENGSRAKHIRRWKSC